MAKPYHSRTARARFYRQEKLKRRLKRLTAVNPFRYGGGPMRNLQFIGRLHIPPHNEFNPILT